MQKPHSPALRLLLACARAHPSEADRQAILALLDANPDWTGFVQKALSHSVAGLAGHTLVRVASGKVPPDIANAFGVLIAQTRERNGRLLDQLLQLVDGLSNARVEVLCFKGPVLAMAAFGDLGLRGFRDLDILIRDRDLATALRCLQALGYRRDGDLTPAQLDVIHHLQGQEVMSKAQGAVVEPHTRLIPLKMALSIDHEELWRRARHREVCGKSLLTFAPEDTLLVLAIHGGKELWWDIKWACDVADFVAAHPELDWDAVAGRARSQGCYRMLLVAAALAHDHLGAKIPEKIVSAVAADRRVEKIIGRVIARWEMDDPGGPPSNKALSLDRFLLHDGLRRRASYVLRTFLLPGPQHVPLVRLPRSLALAYIPIGLAHDLIALPLYRAQGKFRALASRLRDMLN